MLRTINPVTKLGIYQVRAFYEEMKTVPVYMTDETIRTPRQATKELPELVFPSGLESGQRLWTEVLMHHDPLLAEPFSISKQWEDIFPSAPCRKKIVRREG